MTSVWAAVKNKSQQQKKKKKKTLDWLIYKQTYNSYSSDGWKSELKTP